MPRPLALNLCDIHGSQIPRFWQKVQMGDSGECWLWTAATNADGYGLFQVSKTRRTLAHRVAYVLEHGYAPGGGYEIDHKCHNTKCVNPNHLRCVTIKQNQENRCGAQRNNKSSGVRGVSWDKSRSRWFAYVKDNQVMRNLGRYDRLEDAVRAAEDGRRQLFTNYD